ncbi:hypothetical protein ACFSCZ_14055 [Siminovitchia sediminis]|uniref:Uncharacterized protein n=1 Tax=Siminovitchia sediminis TaxID=1274353 RepID=A0ABW4KNN5_9BACI
MAKLALSHGNIHPRGRKSPKALFLAFLHAFLNTDKNKVNGGAHTETN